MDRMNRRAALGIMGSVLVGGAVMGGTLGLSSPAKAFQQQSEPFSWKPQILDPAECSSVAYDGYWYNGYGCAYGSFYAIVGVMGEKFGAPYNQFPFTMLEVGKSGISGWGTICGALLGAASAFALFWGRKERDPMVNELFRWYEQTAFPIYNPGEKAQGVKGDLPVSMSMSPLCHISVGKWCLASGLAEKSKERGERCARITADVAIKAIEIMNAKQKGTFAAAFGTPDSVTHCTSCHGPGKDSPILKGNMDCTPCHSGSVHTADKYKNHP